MLRVLWRHDGVWLRCELRWFLLLRRHLLPSCAVISLALSLAAGVFAAPAVGRPQCLSTVELTTVLGNGAFQLFLDREPLQLKHGAWQGPIKIELVRAADCVIAVAFSIRRARDWKRLWTETVPPEGGQILLDPATKGVQDYFGSAAPIRFVVQKRSTQP